MLRKELPFRGIVLEVMEGDITSLEVDAIVNAANNRLLMGGGVAAAIRRKGGKEIEEEALAKGPIPTGEALATSAGKLMARYVIHGAVMGMDFRTDGEKIRKATESTLRVARELGIETIAFPAFGTGVGGFPMEEAARIMGEAAMRHVEEGTTLRRIIFCLFGKEAYEAFLAGFMERVKSDG